MAVLTSPNPHLSSSNESLKDALSAQWGHTRGSEGERRESEEEEGKIEEGAEVKRGVEATRGGGWW